MISLYSGTPGSGKSYHAVRDIRAKLGRKSKNRVIANFPLDGLPADLAANFEYWDNSEIYISSLVQYAQRHHVRGVEGQCLVVIDEAQCIFNSRDWNGKGIVHAALKRDPDSRMDWIKFFSQHRKLGFNIILIAQSDKMLDKQIRALVEYDVKHIKMNNGFFFFLPTSFLAVEKWYGQHMVLGRQVIWYRKRIAALYDSYAMFDALADADGAQGEPRSGGHPRAACDPPAPTPDAQAARRDAGGFGDLSAHFGAGVDVTHEEAAAAVLGRRSRCGSVADRIMTAGRSLWNLFGRLRSVLGGRRGRGDGRDGVLGSCPNNNTSEPMQ